MTPERIQSLIAAGESLDVEFKGEEHFPLSDDDLVEAVVCLANRASNTPGWLLIGVEDDGRITGARPRHEADRTDPVRLTALIANHTRPSLTPRVAVVPLQSKEIIAVEVPPVPAPVATTKGKYLRRALGGDGRPCCLPMFFHEMHARQADRGAEDYSALVVPDAAWEGLDPFEFERFRRCIRERRSGDQSLPSLPDLELAKALGAVEANGQVQAVRVLGLLLFGKEEALRRRLPTHEVAFQVLPGGQANLDFVRLLAEESRAGRNLGLDDLLILNALWQDRRLSTEEAARLTQKPSADVRAVLNRLVEIGLVEPRGERKGRTWHLSAATYRRLGKPATSASAASNRCSRNRWCCNTWKSTGGSPGARRRNCAGWNVGRPADSWPSLHGMARLPCTGREKGRGMAKVHKYDLGLTLYGCGHKIKPRAIRNCSRANNSNNNPTGMSATTLWTGTYIRTANSRLAWLFVPSATVAAYGQEVDDRIHRNQDLLNGKIELRRRMSRTLEKMAPPAAQLRQQQAETTQSDAAVGPTCRGCVFNAALIKRPSVIHNKRNVKQDKLESL